jgi:hypothetical protein
MYGDIVGGKSGSMAADSHGDVGVRKAVTIDGADQNPAEDFSEE